MDRYRAAIVGATGLVGQELVRILEERNFPISSLRFLTSDVTSGRTLYDWRHAHAVEIISHSSEQSLFRDTDLVFFTEGDDSSRHLVPAAVSAGATVIDSSSVFRLEEDVPLVVPEINAEDIQYHRGIIASPNCSAIILSMAVYPLHKEVPVKRVVVSTYQSVSGLGALAMSELTVQTQQILAGEIPRPRLFPHEIGFNILPQVDVFLDSGYTKEEWQLLEETRKILHDSSILVSATCVRVPIFKGHCAALTLEFSRAVNADRAGDVLARAPGVRIIDDTSIALYPQPRVAAGMNEVLVGRIRQDVFNENGIVMWVAADNIRKGAALNMVQIAEETVQRGWLKAKGQR